MSSCSHPVFISLSFFSLDFPVLCDQRLLIGVDSGALRGIDTANLSAACPFSESGYAPPPVFPHILIFSPQSSESANTVSSASAEPFFSVLDRHHDSHPFQFQTCHSLRGFFRRSRHLNPRLPALVTEYFLFTVLSEADRKTNEFTYHHC